MVGGGTRGNFLFSHAADASALVGRENGELNAFLRH
jgi:hypothetical protein